MRYSLILIIALVAIIVLGCTPWGHSISSYVACDHSALIQVLVALYTTSSLWKGAGGLFQTSLERQMRVCSDRITTALDESELTDTTISALAPIIENCQELAKQVYIKYEMSARIWAILCCIALFLKSSIYPNLWNIILFFPLVYIFSVSLIIYLKGRSNMEKATAKSIKEYKTYIEYAEKIAQRAEEKAREASCGKSQEKYRSKTGIMS